MRRPDDAALSSVALRLAAGEHSAAAELYDATAAQVFALARALTGDTTAAEEVLIATFMEVWRQAPQRFRQEAGTVPGVRAWVLSTAVVLARHRRK